MTYFNYDRDAKAGGLVIRVPRLIF